MELTTNNLFNFINDNLPELTTSKSINSKFYKNPWYYINLQLVEDDFSEYVVLGINTTPTNVVARVRNNQLVPFNKELVLDTISNIIEPLITTED
jgi:hypothetical protein